MEGDVPVAERAWLLIDELYPRTDPLALVLHRRAVDMLNAERRAALEEAAKAICYGCRQGWPREPVPPFEDGAFWHPEWREGCKADAIYRLMERSSL